MNRSNSGVTSLIVNADDFGLSHGINKGKKSKLNESIYNLETSQREKIAQEVKDSLKFSIDIVSKS